MDPQPSLDTLFAGAVTKCTGYYRVEHSSPHRPTTETFIFKDFHLPNCGMPGCVVSFHLIHVAPNGSAHRPWEDRERQYPVPSTQYPVPRKN